MKANDRHIVFRQNLLKVLGHILRTDGRTVGPAADVTAVLISVPQKRLIALLTLFYLQQILFGGSGDGQRTAAGFALGAVGIDGVAGAGDRRVTDVEDACFQIHRIPPKAADLAAAQPVDAGQIQLFPEHPP